MAKCYSPVLSQREINPYIVIGGQVPLRTRILVSQISRIGMLTAICLDDKMVKPCITRSPVTTLQDLIDAGLDRNLRPPVAAVSQHASPNPSRPRFDAPPSPSGSQVYSTFVRLVYHRLQRFLPNTAGSSSKTARGNHSVYWFRSTEEASLQGSGNSKR